MPWLVRLQPLLPGVGSMAETIELVPTMTVSSACAAGAASTKARSTARAWVIKAAIVY